MRHKKKCIALSENIQGPRSYEILLTLPVSFAARTVLNREFHDATLNQSYSAWRAVVVSRQSRGRRNRLLRTSTPHADSRPATVFTLHSRLYDRLGKLCKRAQPSSA